MFEKKVPLFIYCTSPVHMGAGSAIGVIDNPIQRERHTNYPNIAGSGLKGAVRHHLWAQLNGTAGSEAKIVERVFGPSPDSNEDYAGAISFSDAQILAFPVRSPKRAYVYAVSPTTLARTVRTLDIGGIGVQWGTIKGPESGKCLISSGNPNDKLLLESFEFQCQANEDFKNAAQWLSQKAMPEGEAFAFFREKLAKDLVMLSEEDFSYFVCNSTVVEPHVRISDVSGTAEDGGLFYTENLPPETILVSLLMASKERGKEQGLDASAVCNWTLFGGSAEGASSFRGIDGQMVQIGGDATTGRGQVYFRAVKASEKQ